MIAVTWRYPVRQGDIRFSRIFLKLLAEAVKTHPLSGARFIVPHDDVVALRVSREKTIDALRLETIFGDDTVHPTDCIQIEFSSFHRALGIFRFKYLVFPIPHAAQFPRVEKRRPVDELYKLTQRRALDRPRAGE